MVSQIVVIGSGGHGREMIDIIHAINRYQGPTFELLGVLDGSPSPQSLQLLALHAVKFLGADDAWLENSPDLAVRYVIGIADPQIKQIIDKKFTGSGLAPQTLIHPAAWVGAWTHLGDGTVVWPQVSLTVNIETGRHVSLNNGCTVGHDSRIGDYCSIHPNSSISGNVLIAEGVLIGTGAVVLQGRSIGAHAVVGASACVTKNVLPKTQVVGVPAHVS